MIFKNNLYVTAAIIPDFTKEPLCGTAPLKNCLSQLSKSGWYQKIGKPYRSNCPRLHKALTSSSQLSISGWYSKTTCMLQQHSSWTWQGPTLRHGPAEKLPLTVVQERMVLKSRCYTAAMVLDFIKLRRVVHNCPWAGDIQNPLVWYSRNHPWLHKAPMEAYDINVVSVKRLPT